MKKLYSLFAAMFLISALFAGQALAEEGGFVGPSPNVNQVSGLSALDDGADVVLIGMVVKHLGDDYYTFKDKSGEVRVEISDWDDQNVSPTNVVELHGEVDKDAKPLTVDVSKVVKSDMQAKSN